MEVTILVQGRTTLQTTECSISGDEEPVISVSDDKMLCTNMISPWVSKINERNDFGLLSPPGLLLLSKQIKGLPKGWNLQKRCPSCPWREETIAKYESKNPKNPSQDNSNIKHFKHHKKQELIFSQPLTKPEPKVDKAFSKTGNGAHVPGFRFCDCRLKHKTVIKDDYRLSSLPVWLLLLLIPLNSAAVCVG